jgi:carbamoyltransferase
MTISLGIHLGHHSACAVVADGKLVAAIEQERITRRKYDGQAMLSNRLPVREVLAAAGLGLADVEVIVSSFQSPAPGGVGLHLPVVEDGFDLFDPLDPRHIVISHHLAHAACVFGCSGFADAAVVVCDLGGTSSFDGQDFELPFGGYRERMIRPERTGGVRTETLSIYHLGSGGPALRHREYAASHSVPEIFVHGAGSLYDNVARTIFRKENSHGQLMALAAFAGSAAPAIRAEELVEPAGDTVAFRNDWQSRVKVAAEPLDNVDLARAAQGALETALLAYARYAKKLTGSDSFCGTGGVFLNILSNSQIADSGIYQRTYFPSSPHDAGIAVGCAFYGARSWREPNRAYAARPVSDRLGASTTAEGARAAVAARRPLVLSQAGVAASEIARRLADGAIIARCAGRSEFGPRALGGRSLLASPLLASSKDRLNVIKGRQAWRPVAPIVAAERIHELFTGPAVSPYMNYVHWILPAHRERLAALSHPDGSTRAQSLPEDEDPALYAIIAAFGELTGYPILVNTSLNGPGQPILETPDHAMTFFLEHRDIDHLLADELLISRDPAWAAGDAAARSVRIAPDAFLTTLFPDGRPRTLLIRGKFSAPVTPALAALLAGPGPLTLGGFLAALAPGAPDPGAIAGAREFFDSGCLVLGAQGA